MMLFSQACYTVKLTLKVGSICLSPSVVINSNPPDLWATVVFAQAVCLTISNLSLTQNPSPCLLSFIKLLLLCVFAKARLKAFSQTYKGNTGDQQLNGDWSTTPPPVTGKSRTIWFLLSMFRVITYCHSAWAFQSPIYASSSNQQNMLLLTSGPIPSLQILPMPRARGTPSTTV